MIHHQCSFYTVKLKEKCVNAFLVVGAEISVEADDPLHSKLMPSNSDRLGEEAFEIPAVVVIKTQKKSFA